MDKHFVASLLISHVIIRVKDEGLAGSPGLHVIHVNRVKGLRFILMNSRQTVCREMVVVGIEGAKGKGFAMTGVLGPISHFLKSVTSSGALGGPGLSLLS